MDSSGLAWSALVWTGLEARKLRSQEVEKEDEDKEVVLGIPPDSHRDPGPRMRDVAL